MVVVAGLLVDDAVVVVVVGSAAVVGSVVDLAPAVVWAPAAIAAVRSSGLHCACAGGLLANGLLGNEPAMSRVHVAR